MGIFHSKNTLGHTPLMQAHEIKQLERALLSFGKKKLSILEWGSGGSTIYFTDFLKRHGIKYEWISIEYNKNWYEKIKDLLSGDKNIQIYLFDVGNNSLKQRQLPMDEYINFPSTLGKKFDLILVDGRKRRRCVLEAKHMLDDGGMVFLHDAQRSYYHCAFAQFLDQKFVGINLWVGRLKEIGLIRKFVNEIQSSIFILYFNAVIRPVRFIAKKIYYFLTAK